MARRFVVVVTQEGSREVYGAWQDESLADAFCGKVNERLEPLSETPDETPAWAYVIELKTPRVREAVNFATRPLDSA